MSRRVFSSEEDAAVEAVSAAQLDYAKAIGETDIALDRLAESLAPLQPYATDGVWRACMGRRKIIIEERKANKTRLSLEAGHNAAQEIRDEYSRLVVAGPRAEAVKRRVLSILEKIVVMESEKVDAAPQVTGAATDDGEYVAALKAELAAKSKYYKAVTERNIFYYRKEQAKVLEKASAAQGKVTMIEKLSLEDQELPELRKNFYGRVFFLLQSFGVKFCGANMTVAAWDKRNKGNKDFDSSLLDGVGLTQINLMRASVDFGDAFRAPLVRLRGLLDDSNPHNPVFDRDSALAVLGNVLDLLEQAAMLTNPYHSSTEAFRMHESCRRDCILLARDIIQSGLFERFGFRIDDKVLAAFSEMIPAAAKKAEAAKAEVARGMAPKLWRSPPPPYQEAAPPQYQEAAPPPYQP